MTPDKTHQPTTGPWYRWRGYTVRWVLFGLVVHVFQPIEDDVEPLWLYKLDQALTGLLFGAVCSLVFTWTENRFNTPRVQWKSWLIVAGTWLCVKTAFISTLAIVGP
ncbi:hypothetical protein [Rhodoferax sp.]|uniref:hypothetical protein n=1 Tax=Rhodoferax sp. TaxID=50421 RepID=UPI00260247FA|nr:hypothetical protein [Rhodoferax sp.]MDD2926964.1 hypothetical protein [Rhodoferax sp.]